MGSAMYGPPPWEHGPTPPLEVFAAEQRRNPNIVWQVQTGHLVNLLEEALDRWHNADGRAVAAETMLQDYRERDERRKAVKRDNQARFRAARKSRLNGRPS